MPKTAVEWFKLDLETQKIYKNLCISNKSIAISLYIFVYVSLAILIIGSVFMLQSMIKKHQQEYHKEHKSTLISYSVQLLLSIAVKLYLTTDLMSYDSDTIPIYATSELLIMVLFSVFKKDDDWFKCYQRTAHDTYSIFQIPERQSNIDDDWDDDEDEDKPDLDLNDEDFKDQLIEANLTESPSQNKKDTGVSGRDSSNIQSHMEASLPDRRSMDSDYFLQQQLEIEKREAKRTIIEDHD